LRSPAFICVLAVGFASSATAGVTATDAWVRGMVKGQNATGAFLTITSTEPAKLVGIKSASAPMVEIHTSAMQNGVMQMHAIESIDLPAGKPVQLKPGGNHVMLMGVAKPLGAGDTVPLTLLIESGGKRTEVPVQAEVRPLGK
jgi:copper(I)-binding protein